MRAGVVPSAPLVPTIGFDIQVMELYRVLSKNHRRLGLQPFVRAILEFQGHVNITSSAYTFSKAYDCFLLVNRHVKRLVENALGQSTPDDRLLRSCPACLYSLDGEVGLPHTLLLAMDANMSLRCFNKVGTADTACFQSSYFLDRDFVDKYADVVQVRGSSTNQRQKKGKSKDTDEAIAHEENLQDAHLEMSHGGSDTQPRRNEATYDDPLAKAFAALDSDCAERWKANADDGKKVMWDCFEECGIFLTICRHGIVLLACDIIRSGEL
jgi:hypothetical protein